MDEQKQVTAEEMTHQEYLQRMAGELMADEEWPFPKELRFFLVNKLDWTLLGL